jgi:hypothetical protein
MTNLETHYTKWRTTETIPANETEMPTFPTPI